MTAAVGHLSLEEGTLVVRTSASVEPPAMETWIESIVRSANGIPMAAGVLGALVAYALAARLGLHNGVRLGLSVVSFAALFVVGGGFLPRPRAILDDLSNDASDADERKNTPPPLWKYAGFATNATGTDLASFFEDALRELHKDPVVCVNFLYSVVHSRIPTQLSIGLEIRFQQLTARVAREGGRAAEPRPDSLSAVALNEMMVRQLRESHGERRAREILTIMSDPANGLSKPREVCEAATAVYSTIADMPPSKGGALMRYMLDRQAVAPARHAVAFWSRASRKRR